MYDEMSVGNQSSITIKGFGGKNAPLYIVDGEEVKEKAFKKIQPEDIANVKVLKDESAKELYGRKGRNGVLLISTKKNSKEKVTLLL